MKWTREPPTEPGWYWWRERARAVKFIREVIRERKRGRLMASDLDDWLHVDHPEVKGEWSGPIPEPQEEQQ